jgi:NAD(P)-dependent dehydrogenase (short-subunit alcohol dehydrogenase family)
MQCTGSHLSRISLTLTPAPDCQKKRVLTSVCRATTLLMQYGYRMSKTAVNMAGKLLAEDLAARHIPVGIVHPGAVRRSQL